MLYPIELLIRNFLIFFLKKYPRWDLNPQFTKFKSAASTSFATRIYYFARKNVVKKLKFKNICVYDLLVVNQNLKNQLNSKKIYLAEL